MEIRHESPHSGRWLGNETSTDYLYGSQAAFVVGNKTVDFILNYYLGVSKQSFDVSTKNINSLLELLLLVQKLSHSVIVKNVNFYNNYTLTVQKDVIVVSENKNLDFTMLVYVIDEMGTANRTLDEHTSGTTILIDENP